jgi:hypothetical protein
MKSGLTYIIFVIDRSGSMSSIRADMIGGFNSFIKAQRDANIGDCRVFAYQFDTEYSTIFENVDINKVSNLTEKTYEPRGGTALYNSLGKTINNIGILLSSLPESERPEKVLVVTITDGEDNSLLTNDSEAQNYTSAKVKEMVKHQTEVYRWDFAYIGANQDAWAVGGSMGVANNLNYAATSAGTAYAFDNLTKSTLSYRSAGVATAFAFSPDTKDDQANVNPVAKKTKIV